VFDTGTGCGEPAQRLGYRGVQRVPVGNAPPTRGCRGGGTPPIGTPPTRAYSHSIVPGGLLVMSSTTRPTGRISLIIREAIFSSRS
jgi:hypothetical protein